MAATTRVYLLLLTTWIITWFAITNQVQGAGRRTPPPPPPPPPITTIATLNLDNPTTYGPFITGLRNTLADVKTLQCTFQKMKTPTIAQRYAYIDLKTGTQTVTLVIDTADLYVLGYRDKTSTGLDRFFYLKDAQAVANKFFPGANNNRIKLTYNGNYIDLEKNAGTRASNPLGIANLKFGIMNIYAKAVNVKLQSKFFLQAIQMVSEAARFKYISDKIPQDDHSSVTVDDKMIALENGWASLSNVVYKSKASKTTATKCVLATSPAKLGPWTFTTVEGIKQVLGLLKS